MKITTFLTLLCSLLITQVAWAEVFKVKLRPGVHVEIEATVLENPDADQNGAAALMIHGLAHTGNTFIPLANEVFSNPATSANVERVLLLNLPNRGGSGIPFGRTNVSYGDLDLNDDATIVIKTLEHFEGEDLSPSLILAHSMGGLIVQMVQQRLISEGSSLSQEFGVTDIVLMSSSSPAEVPDPFLESGTGLFLLDIYTMQDPSLGPIASLDIGSFMVFFFTFDPFAVEPQFVLGTPSPEVIASQYKADESYAAALQTLGVSALRPSVSSGVFAPQNGTTLRILVPENDPFADEATQLSLYNHLTSNATLENFVIVSGTSSAHDQYIAEPAPIVLQLGW